MQQSLHRQKRKKSCQGGSIQLQQKKQINKIKKGGAQKACPHKRNSKALGNVEFTVQQRLNMVEIWQNTANRTGRKQGLAAK